MGSFSLISFALDGIEALPVTIEVDIGKGLPGFAIVGLPDAAISESKDRVRSAIQNSGFSFPRTRVTINLAPASLRKSGPAFDLGIALGILAASKQVNPLSVARYAYVGELGLQGDIRHVHGTMLFAEAAENHKMPFFCAEHSVEQALLACKHVVSASSLKNCVEGLQAGKLIERTPQYTNDNDRNDTEYDFAYVYGQKHAKRALEIAAAGGHNVLMSGPPGSGKTLLARSFPSILPMLDRKEALEVMRIHSAKGIEYTNIVSSPPFRAPHHSSSSTALIGGGTHPLPGEVSLAHRGVLFLDELPEFSRKTIEHLRQPIEDGFVHIARAAGSYRFPSRFTLIAAMNPCPCGFSTDKERLCTCAPHVITRYQQKISGPILDRIDAFVHVPRIPIQELKQKENESSEVIRTRITQARDLQMSRQKSLNAIIPFNELKRVIQIQEKAQSMIDQAYSTFHLSTRGYARLCRIARTIADLSQSEQVTSNHVGEALQLRIRLPNIG